MTDADKKTTDEMPKPDGMPKPEEKPKPDEKPRPDEKPDPVEGGPDTDETRFPRKNTEQNREMRPGAMTRDEIRERTHRNKD